MICFFVPEIWHLTDVIVNFHFGLFFSLLPPNIPKKNLKKWKKIPRDNIILHNCTKSHDHTLYSSWDMVHDRYNYFSFWAIFWTFTPTNSLKNQNFKNMKKMPGDIILHKCTKNDDHMLYCSWDMTRVGCNCYFQFGLYFSLLPP